MKIGNLTIHQPVILAPMQDVTDASFRLVCKSLGADIVFTEFISCEALIRSIPRTLKKIKVYDQERPIAIQIFGSKMESLVEAVQIAETYDPAFIDLNCGCCNKKLALRGEGAGLLRDLPHMEKIIRAMVRATTKPVTVKTRLGWDDRSIQILDVARMVEQAGAQALSLHCRTRVQGYQGQADWSWLEKVRQVIRIPLIGNGDVKTPQDARTLMDLGCDGVMVGRGALTSPWLFKEIKHFLSTGQHLPAASLQERIEICLRHLRLSVQEKGLRDGVITFRKHYSGYLHGFPGVAKVRSELMMLKDVDAIIQKLTQVSSGTIIPCSE